MPGPISRTTILCGDRKKLFHHGKTLGCSVWLAHRIYFFQPQPLLNIFGPPRAWSVLEVLQNHVHLRVRVLLSSKSSEKCELFRFVDAKGSGMDTPLMALLMLAWACRKNPRVEYLCLFWMLQTVCCVETISLWYQKIMCFEGQLRSRSEINKSARRFAKNNLPTPQQPLVCIQTFGVFFFKKKIRSFSHFWFRNGNNMFTQSLANFHKKVALYTAGFPCQPYSLLNSSSAMLSDPNSEQLWKSLQNIGECKPAASWLCKLCVIHFTYIETLRCFAHLIGNHVKYPVEILVHLRLHSSRMCWDSSVW